LPKDRVEGRAMTRSKAIRKWYVWWCGGSANEARECRSTTHPLYPYRLGGGVPEGYAATDRAKAIREYCLDCCGFSARAVRKCTFTDCPLYPYRFGYRKKGSIGGSKRKTKAQAGSCMAEEVKTLKQPYIG